MDYYHFNAQTGDQLYTSTQTLWSASGTADTVIEVLDPTWATVLKTDNNDGSYGKRSSVVAGLYLPAAEQYYLRVTENGLDDSVNRYDLFFQIQSGTIGSESEPNDTEATTTTLPAVWVAGTASSTSDTDLFSFSANAGDAIVLMLDLAPTTRTRTR